MSPIVIVHYHLRPGGVTRVIETLSHALTEADIPHLILTGSTSTQTHLPVALIEGLDYPSSDPEPDFRSCLSAMKRAVAEHFGEDSPSPIWHFHNHSLGKNRVLAPIVSTLAQEGVKLLLHIHDLAEDGRPSNYQLISDQQIYPISPTIRYACLNRRDFSCLLNSGLDESQIDLIDNPVPEIPPSSASHQSSPLVFYPVRGIRRKNLGELCLIAAQTQRQAPSIRFAIGLAPENPSWQEIHQAWVEFSDSQNLPLHFAVTDRVSPDSQSNSSYASWLTQATHLITTSVAEGFGLTFLEAQAIGKPLIGRDLPNITTGLRKHGAAQGALYQKLLVPSSWIKPSSLQQQLHSDLSQIYQSYGQELRPDIFEQSAAHLKVHHNSEDYYDFGNLPEDIQREVICQLIDEKDGLLVEYDAQREPLATWIERAIIQSQTENIEPLSSHFNRQSYLQRLLPIYQELAQSPKPQEIRYLSQALILTQYLSPKQFHFLRT